MVNNKGANRRSLYLCLLMVLIVGSLPLSAWAQGSIFGTVQNSDLSTPANGDMSFFGFLDDTDEEIRIETSTGAGYDAGNWFDDFQNYLTEAPGNPYDHYFFNVVNEEGFHLAGTIPSNSFQQEDITLAATSSPAQPAGPTATPVSSGTIVVAWEYVTGLTYHVYRRPATSDGSFFRLDDPAGSLGNPGVADSFFVDNGVDGVISYDYVIIAEDGSANYSQHSSVVTVNSSVLAAPIVNSVDPSSGLSLGGTFVNVYGSGFDMSGVGVVVGSASLTGITVVSPFHITGTTQAGTPGPADVTVANTLSALSSTLIGGFTYTANTYPVLAAIGPQSVTEGNPLSFIATATDTDGGNPVMTSSALPPGATYIDNGDGTASFDWTPTFFDAGVYNVTYYATDDAEPTLVDSEQVVITVLEAGNQLPVLATIGAQSTTEQVPLSFSISASDVDGVILLTTSVLPSGAAFLDNGDGTGGFNWTPDFTQAGIYSVTFYATDDSLAIDSEVVAINVLDAGNQNPVLTAIGPQTTDENVLLSFGVSASDIDGDIPVLSTSALPAGAAFLNNGDGTGTFDWIPTFADSGTYDVTFYATDGLVPSAVDSEIVTITVNNVNQLVSLSAIGDQAIAENANLNLVIAATDLDGDIPVMTSSALPGAATFVDNLDGTATFDWIPTYNDSGAYAVTFYATDGAFPAVIDSETITITVTNTNRVPILAAIGQQIGQENVNLTFGVTSTDDDGDNPVLSTTSLPGTATFLDNGDGTGTFDWTPTSADSGSYDVTFYATDGVYPADADSEIVTIIVGDDNQLPVLAAIGDQAATEGVLLSFAVSASDPDGDFPLLSAAPLPAEAILTDNGDGTGSFDWTPGFSSAGNHIIAFYATDAGYPTVVDSETITITVGEAGNQAPEFLTIAAQNSPEGSPVNFVVTANDPDGDIPTLWSSVLPTGATFVDNLDCTGTFDWIPDYTQAGDYLITFYADDGEFVDSTQVSITVTDAGNQPPVVAPVALQATSEGGHLIFVVTAVDPDATIPILTSGVLPTGAAFTDNTDGTGTFDWIPDFAQVGSYDVTFYADDGEFIDSTSTIITVADNLAPPTLDPIGPQAGSEGVMLTFAVSGSDTDGTFPVLSAAPLPAGAALVDNLDGTGTFSWLPAFNQAGIHDVTFTSDDGEFTATELVTFTISEAGDQPPVIDSIADTTVNEGTVLVINVSGSDPEGLPIAMNASTTLNNYSFIDNGDGTGVLTYSSDFYDVGTDTVRIFATEIGGGGLAAMELFVITTVDVNQPPFLAPVGPFNMVVFDTLIFDVVVSDSTDPNPDAIVFLPTDGLPTGATFVDNGDNSGTFTFAPDYGQDGVYNLTFWAVDQGNPPMSSSLPVDITVQTTNLPPEMTEIGPQALTEGETLTLLLSATDADGGVPPVLLVDTLVENAVFVDSGNGFGTYTFSPSFVQSGLYFVSFGATDGIDTTLLDPVLIQVYEAGNQSPIFDSIPLDSVVEGLTLEGIITAHDPDLTPVTITVDSLTTPENFTFVDSGNGIASFVFSPSFSQAGIYDITVIASDGELQTSVVMTLIAIEAGNQPPVLDTILDYSVIENELLEFTVTASDIDGASPLLSTSTLPGSASFDDLSGLFSWQPTFSDSGSYVITFYATDADDALIIDSQNVNIAVIDVNRTPWVLILPGHQDTVYEGQDLNLYVTSYDDDGPIPFIEAYLEGEDKLATNMTFTTEVVGNTREGTLTFSPDFTQGGPPPGNYYVVRFLVIDSVDAGLTNESGNLPLRVFQVNLPPYMNFSAGPGPFEINEGETLAFNVQAVDPDGTIPTLQVENLPDSNYSVSQPSADIAIFMFTPSFTQAGLYQISFIAEDDSLAADTQIVEINVVDAGNQPPAFSFILPDTVPVWTTILYDTTIEAFDPEGYDIVLEAFGLPANSTWDTTGGVGSFAFTPDNAQIGSVYPVQFVVTDITSASDTMTCHFVVSSFLRGDTDANSKYTVNDIVVLAAYMFRGGPEPAPLESADSDGSGEVNVADLAYIVNFMYHAGPRPPQ